MVDTVRSVADLLVLFADNTNGDISPQDLRDAIVSFEALAPTLANHATVTTQGISTGDFYLNGFYSCPVTDSNLTQAATTQTHGSANSSSAAHAIVVAAAAGVTDGGDLVLTVSGTSITDAGVRTTGDSETVVSDCTASSTNSYYETTKKWLGQVTYTLTSSGGTAFNYDFNYGYASYDDFANTDFTLNHFTFEWFGGANDPGFEIAIHHHKAAGWTYHATAFHPGAPPIYLLSTDHSTDSQVFAGEYGRWKRTDLSDAIAGAALEGLVVHITTTVNNSVEWCNSSMHVKTAA